jgi:hypothetical protein
MYGTDFDGVHALLTVQLFEFVPVSVFCAWVSDVDVMAAADMAYVMAEDAVVRDRFVPATKSEIVGTSIPFN